MHSACLWAVCHRDFVARRDGKHLLIQTKATLKTLPKTLQAFFMGILKALLSFRNDDLILVDIEIHAPSIGVVGQLEDSG